VTFGGAYAILPYVAQEAVHAWHWLTPAQMMTGLGLAESTPGPLIMVLQYVGFVAAWQQPGALDPLTAATLGALLTTWVTFLPGFIWIFLFAPALKRIESIRPLRQALWGITAAVTGLMLHLTLQFGAGVLCLPEGGIRWPMLALAAGFFVVFEKGWVPVPLGMIVAAGIGGVGLV
jgi:chromate transporter